MGTDNILITDDNISWPLFHSCTRIFNTTTQNIIYDRANFLLIEHKLLSKDEETVTVVFFYFENKMSLTK